MSDALFKHQRILKYTIDYSLAVSPSIRPTLPLLAITRYQMLHVFAISMKAIVVHSWHMECVRRVSAL
ncbi:unnamed protein product [Toxocara canis]|uniref:Ovule protein n=1 Tax=Toxocara canis TaxID=6265 RepID=A0A183U953_TOXCA|nr:unnamed protein product [Toxocara canis]